MACLLPCLRFPSADENKGSQAKPSQTQGMCLLHRGFLCLDWKPPDPVKCELLMLWGLRSRKLLRDLLDLAFSRSLIFFNVQFKTILRATLLYDSSVEWEVGRMGSDSCLAVTVDGWFSCEHLTNCLGGKGRKERRRGRKQKTEKTTQSTNVFYLHSHGCKTRMNN